MTTTKDVDQVRSVAKSTKYLYPKKKAAPKKKKSGMADKMRQMAMKSGY